MFHGTRASAARAIQDGGFDPTPVADTINEVAETYGLPVEDLRADLERNGRFAVSTPRTSGVYITGDRDRAARYADRGPEARWESLWAVFRLRHGLGYDWNASDAGHLWVLAQHVDDSPVVISSTVRLGALSSGGGATAADGIMRAVSAGTDFEFALQRVLRVAEWLTRPEDVVVGEVAPAPLRVDHYLMVFMAGVTIPEFEEQLRSDFWGEPGGQHPVLGDWFPFDQVWKRLSVSRQAYLEDMVGKRLTPPSGQEANSHAQCHTNR